MKPPLIISFIVLLLAYIILAKKEHKLRQQLDIMQTNHDYSLDIHMDTVWMYNGTTGELLGRCKWDSITEFILKDNL